jgi:integrase
MGKATRRERITSLRSYAPPQSGYYLVYDEDVRRLALAVYASGRKVFKFLYHRKGKTRWLTIGEVKPDVARKRGFELSDQVTNQKRDPQAEAMQEKLVGSFAELRERYFAEFAEEERKSFAQSRYLLTKYVPQRFNGMKLNEIKRADVRTVLGGIPKYSVGTAVLAAMSAVFSWGEEQEVVAVNPCRGIVRKKSNERGRVLEDDEIRKFWPALGQHGAVGSVLRLVLLSGQRPGECARINRAHLAGQMEGSWWNMPGKPVPTISWRGTKNSEDHRVWLPAAVLELIADYSHGNNLVFSQPHLLQMQMRRLTSKLCRELGAEPIQPRDLRRTFGTTVTRLYGRATGRAIMNRIMNHVERGVRGTTYDRYGYDDECRQAMERVVAEILRIAEGREESNVVALTPARVG